MSVTVETKLSTLSAAEVISASHRLKGVSRITPLEFNERLSIRYGADIYLKREDLQVVRSYKLRGAYNKMSLLDAADREMGVICASAGNHAQGVAYACHALQIFGRIVMPVTTPRLKVQKVRKFGGSWVTVILKGDTFDDAQAHAYELAMEQQAIFIHPFDDAEVIAGQGTVGKEILDQCPSMPEVVVAPIGGGGLAAGLSVYFRQLDCPPILFGAEPLGAPAMYQALRQGKPVLLAQIEKFVDGAAVRRVGDLTYELLRDTLTSVVLVPEGRVCTALLDLYHEEAIVSEPAGALSVAALDLIQDEIKGKTVVCILSGGNNDISRTEEIRERSLLDLGLKHYFIIRFPQRAGALREFVAEVLGPEDDITFFEYMKRNHREMGPAIVGIEYPHAAAHEALVERMHIARVDFEAINGNPTLFHLLVS